MRAVGEQPGTAEQMDDIGFWEGITRELSGKGQFRVFLQPILAILLGTRFGISDAKRGASPFVRRLLLSKSERWRLLGRSIRDVWMPLSLALVMDGTFQYLTLGRVRVSGAIVVGILLVWLPFASARGISNRIWRRSQLQLSARR
jgi:hypothetical protein